MFLTINSVYLPKQHAVIDYSGNIMYSCDREIEFLCAKASTEPVEISAKIV
jgi:hypothetical protein